MRIISGCGCGLWANVPRWRCVDCVACSWAVRGAICWGVAAVSSALASGLRRSSVSAGLVISVRAILQYLYIKREWRQLPTSARQRLIFFY